MWEIKKGAVAHAHVLTCISVLSIMLSIWELYRPGWIHVFDVINKLYNEGFLEYEWTMDVCLGMCVQIRGGTIGKTLRCAILTDEDDEKLGEHWHAGQCKRNWMNADWFCPHKYWSIVMREEQYALVCIWRRNCVKLESIRMGLLWTKWANSPCILIMRFMIYDLAWLLTKEYTTTITTGSFSW